MDTRDKSTRFQQENSCLFSCCHPCDWSSDYSMFKLIVNKSANIYLFWIVKDHQTPYVWNIVSQLPKSQMVLNDTRTMRRSNTAYMIPKAAE